VLPPALRGITFDELAASGGRPVGVIRDSASASMTAVIAVRGRSFTLLDAADKDRRLGSWAALLSGLSREGGAVRSLQWVERTLPGDAEELARHLHEALAVEGDSPAARSYAELVAEAGPLGRDHQCFVALSVRVPRGRRRAVTPEDTLVREVRLLEGNLRTADVEVDHVLGLREIGSVLRTSYDPWSRAGIGRRAALHPDLPGPLPESAWPVSADDAWSSLRTDGAWHATFWVAEWPRSEVGPDFLSPLLLSAGCQRTVSVHLAPLPPSAGVREAEAARTAQVADEQLRQRAGFLPTARRRRQAEGLAAREAELSDGHAAYRFSGYVTVTAQGAPELETACGEILQAGHQCRLELRRLYGVQDLAFTWTMPLGRGLAVR
jgi:hypothetical protein